MIKRKLRAIGANIFAGGFTLGVRKHFDVLGHLEHDNYGAEVSRLNLGVDVSEDQGDWPNWLDKWKDPIDFIYSNPPCAVWSTIGGNSQSGRDWRKDPRLQRIRDIFALIDVKRPRAWCWESVCPAFSKGREFVDDLVAQAAKKGYSSTFVFIDAKWHGLAQTRRRFFLVCHDVEIDWDNKPAFSTGKSAFDVIRGETPKVMGDIKMKKGSILEKIIKTSKPGEPMAKAYERLFGEDYPRNERGQALGRLARSARRLGADGPSGAVVSPWLWHPKEHRQLSVEEFKALCGFPRSFKFPDKMRHDPCIRYLARGVMPPVGEWLASNIADAIRKNRRVKTPRTMYADFRTPPGVVCDVQVYEAPPERAQRVPGAPRKPREPRLPRPKIDFDTLPVPSVPRGVPMSTSGAFIKHLLQLGKYPDEVIAAMVRKNFSGRTTTVSDVSYNRGKLKKLEGIIAPRIPFTMKERSS